MAVSQKKGLPYFVTTISSAQPKDYKPHNVFNVMPDTADQVKAVTDAINKFQWKNVTVLYDNLQGRVYRYIAVCMVM